MNVNLPNGVLMQGVPDDATDDQIKAEAIRLGVAHESDFPFVQKNKQEVTRQEPNIQYDQQGRPAIEKNPSALGFISDSISGLFHNKDGNENAVGNFINNADAVAEAGLTVGANALPTTYEIINQGGQSMLNKWIHGKDTPVEDVNKKIADSAWYHPSNPLTPEYLNKAAPIFEALGAVAPVAGGIESQLASNSTKILANDTKTAIRGGIQAEIQGAKNIAQAPSNLYGYLKSKAVKENAANVDAPMTPPADVPELIKSAAESFSSPRNAQNIDSLVSRLKPDPKLVDAANKLGILDETPASILTSDIPTKEVIGQLNAAGGNAVSEAHIAFNNTLKNKANELVKEANGDLDSAALNKNLQDEMSATHELIKSQASNAHELIDKNIVRGGEIDASPMLREINQSAKDLENGVQDLSLAEKEVYKKLSGKPTYANVDILRKKIGNAIGAFNGPWNDANSATLNRLYAGLTDLQEAASRGLSDNPNIVKMWTSAKDLDKQKFALQDSMDFIFGDKKGDFVAPKMDTALSLMANKQSPKTFNDLIAHIPKDHQQAVVSTSLRNIMTGTIRGEETANIGKFNTWYGNLERSPALKKQFESYLPEGVPEKLKSYSDLSKSFANSTAVPRTGIVKDVFKTSPNRIIDRLYGGLESVPTVGEPISKVSQWVIKKSEPKAVVADKILSSKEFKTAILDYKKYGNPESKVQKTFKENQLYSDYLNQTSNPQVTQIGLVPFLFMSNESQNK